MKLEMVQQIHNGTIILLKSKNVGIDLQGTHQGTMTPPAITTVINSGSIIGHSDGINNKEQIAFGFNNADASNNTTMTHMINRKIITLNSPSSAGIQLKPEDPHNWIPSNWSTAPLQISSRTTQRTLGRVLMKADNEGDINVNGTGSFGIVTIFNNGVPIDLFAPSFLGSFENLKSERSYAGVRVLPGGEIGRSALTDSKYTSGIYNRSTGNIEFVKNGACPTFIKSKNKVEVIKAISLQAGIVDKIDLVVYDKDLKGGEIVVMCSDGILESNQELENKELWVKDMLENIETDDVQKIADIVLQEAIDNDYGIPKDDMTVLVAKIERI